MLKVFFGEDGKAHTNPDTVFENINTIGWMDDPFIRKMVEDVDRVKVLDTGHIMSPIFGAISPRDLSGGVKTLMMLYKRSEILFDLICCGENCGKWLLEISKMHDIEVTTSGTHMLFKNEDVMDGLCLNNGEYFKTGFRYCVLAGTYVLNSRRNMEE